MRKKDETIAIYSRKSRFTGKGESIGNQVELCRDYIRLHDGEAAASRAVIFEDEGFSGGNLNRPAFKRMMESARKKQLSAIIVYRLDRISRNIGDFSNLIDELGKLGVSFVSIREQFDTATPMGRAMMYIASVFSQLERETIAERIRDNMHELAKTGRWLGGITPTGFSSKCKESITIDGKPKKVCMLELVPEEAEMIQTIFRLFLESGSLSSVESALIQRGIHTKNGRFHTRFSIRSILQNPVYAIADQAVYDFFIHHKADLFSDLSCFDGIHGIMAYNRTFQEKGKSTVYRPIEEWIVAVGRHPGLIAGRSWVDVQEALERNRSGHLHTSRGNEALLTGLLYCRCGSRMYPKQRQKGAFSYVCKTKDRSRRAACICENICGHAADEAVLSQMISTPVHSQTLIAELERHRRLLAGTSASPLSSLQRTKESNERRIATLIDSLALLEEQEAREQMIQRIKVLTQENTLLTKRIHALQCEKNSLISDEEACQQLCSFESCLTEIGLEAKRSALRKLLNRVVWDGSAVHVWLAGTKDEWALWREDCK